jgi:hypothetical protein
MRSKSTRTADVHLTEDGIAIVRIRPKLIQSVDDARENVAAAAQLAGKLVPILTDIREAEPLSAETRHFYSGKQLTDYFTALAILIRASALGTMMGNVYVRVARPGVPFRLFRSEEQAILWLQGFLTGK